MGGYGRSVETLAKSICLVDRQIEWVEKCILAELSAVHRPIRRNDGHNLKWTGSVIEWVELIYAIHASGAVNGGKTTIKRLFRVMGEVFDFEVKEFSRAFIDIKGRVRGDRTKFLDVLKRSLISRMEESDCKLSKR